MYVNYLTNIVFFSERKLLHKGYQNITGNTVIVVINVIVALKIQYLLNRDVELCFEFVFCLL